MVGERHLRMCILSTYGYGFRVNGRGFHLAEGCQSRDDLIKRETRFREKGKC